LAWDPFKDMKKFRKEMDKTFDVLSKSFEKSFNQVHKTYHRTFNLKQPKTEISQDLKKVIVSIELPGMSKRDMSLKITENHLEIFAEKKKKIKIKRVSSEGVTYIGYRRIIPLPANVVPGKAVAVYKKDKLIVRIPKTNKEVSKNVTVT